MQHLSVPTRNLRALAGALLLTLAACSPETPDRGAPEAPQPAMTMAAAFVDTTSEFPRLRFEDGSISLTDRCPVRRARLNPRMPPLFVNGHPVGFC